MNTVLKYGSGFIFGCYLGYLGHTIFTKEYWIILVLVFVLMVTHSKD